MMFSIKKNNIEMIPSFFFLRLNGKPIRNDSWIVDFIYGDHSETIICTKIEKCKIIHNGEVDCEDGKI